MYKPVLNYYFMVFNLVIYCLFGNDGTLKKLLCLLINYSSQLFSHRLLPLKCNGSGNLL